MDKQLKQIAQNRYAQDDFVKAVFELALEKEWLSLERVIQHDMAKAILADYSCKLGKGYLDDSIFFNNWENVIEIGWRVFFKRTGISKKLVQKNLKQLHDSF